ncbi:NAD(P)-dependent oxidoreductase, partial [Clostridium chromiireducens]|uniref:NAD(P)-dependent oxidoreductase n=1 Tax=Clostridium chromiireducens TaxID=225345 RepID=UPI003AF9C911
DIISLHVPLNETTKGLINSEKLLLMKESAILINTARGPVVDSAALAEALNSGKIAGAGVDVFEVEPPIPVDHVLFGAKNLLVTPHVAFATAEAFEKRAVIVFDNIEKWLKGTPQNVM